MDKSGINGTVNGACATSQIWLFMDNVCPKATSRQLSGKYTNCVKVKLYFKILPDVLHLLTVDVIHKINMHTYIGSYLNFKDKILWVP